MCSSDLIFQCLEDCLDKQTPEKRKMARRYYQFTGQARIEDHKKMAEEMGIADNALKLRMFRLRAELYDCIRGCEERAKQNRVL